MKLRSMIDSKLEAAIRDAWGAATSAADNNWETTNPSAGHCDVTSLVVREHIGGDLKLAQVFRNGELSEHHYWNVLPDGTEVDLTADQFDGTETFGDATLLDAAFFASAGPMRPELVQRLDHFRRGVDSHLATGRVV